jgi:DME family drug/metabolite transporter
MPSPMRSRLALVGAAVLFSTGGAAIKLTSLPATQVAGLRALIAGLFLLLALRVPWRSFGRAAWLIGCAQAATMLLFVVGNKLTTAASTIFLQSTAPLYVLALSPALLGERVRRSDVAFLGLFALGLALFFVGSPPAQATAPDPLRGNLVGVAGGMTWAATVLGLRWLALRQSEVAGTRAPLATAGSRDPDFVAAAMVIGNLLAFLACVPWLVPLAPTSGGDLLLVLWLGVFQVGMAYALVSRGVKGVTAFDATLLMLIEPVLNPVWTWLVHGETPGAWALAGGVVILCTTALRSWYTARA